MAGVQKQFELLFKLSASLGPNFDKSFKKAVDTQKTLSDSMKKVRDQQSKVDAYNKASKAITEQTGKVQSLKQEHEKIAKSLERHKANAQQLRAKIEETGDASGELTAQLIREQSEIQKDTEKLAKNETQIQQTTAKIENQTTKLNELGKELQEAGISTDSLGDKNEELQKTYERLAKQQEKLGGLKDQQKQIEESISGTKTELLKTTGAIAAVATAVYAGPVKSAMEYETAMNKVATIADTNVVPIDQMSKDIAALSNETGIAASQIADDVYNAISAGQNTADAVNFVSNSTKLAKAGFAESSQTLDVLTTILNAYGMSADKVNNVSDMLVQTQNKGKVTVGELSSVMGKIIPTANANNVALEQLTAGYAIMTSKGIAAAESTTYMNSMFNELGKTGTTADKTLRKVGGGSFKELMASGKSVGEVLQILEDAAKKDGLALSDMFGSAEAGKAAMSLLSDGVEGFNSQVQGMLEASDGVGATQAAFDKVSQSTAEKMQKAKNSVANLGITLGQTFLPIVGTVADKLNDLVTKTTKYASDNPKVVKTVVTLASALAGLKLGALGAKLGFLEGKKGINLVQQAITKLNILKEGKKLGTFAMSFGKIFKIVAPGVGIIAAIGGAIYYIATHLEDVRKKIQETFGEEGLAVFDQVWGAITQVGDAIKNAFAGNAPGMLDALKAALPPVIEALQSAAQTILPVLVNLVQQLAPVLANLVSQILPVIAQLIGAIVPIIAQLVQTILPILAQILAQIIPVVAQIITAVLPVLQQLISSIAQILGAILPILMQIITTVLPMFQTLLTALTPVIQFLAQILTAGLGAALTTITNLVNNVMQIFQGLIDFITGVFTGNWSQAWEGVKSIFSGIFGGLGEIFKAPFRVIVSAINTVIGGLNKLKVPDWVPGIGGKGINIPLIPAFAKGTDDTPDSFIAGEDGPELITNAPHRAVYTAAQTESIMSAQKAAAKATEAPEMATPAPEMKPTGGSGGSKTVVINQTNTITINGDKPDGLEETLKKNNEELLQQVDEKLNGEDDERRTRYE